MLKISKVNLVASAIASVLLVAIVTTCVAWMSTQVDILPTLVGANSIAFVFAIAAWNGAFDQKNMESLTWGGWLFCFFVGIGFSLVFMTIDCGGHLPAFHPEFVCDGKPGIAGKFTFGTLCFTAIALPSALRAFVIEKFDKEPKEAKT